MNFYNTIKSALSRLSDRDQVELVNHIVWKTDHGVLIRNLDGETIEKIMEVREELSMPDGIDDPFIEARLGGIR